MAKQKEIKFRLERGDLVGRKNGMEFRIYEDQRQGAAHVPGYYVAVYQNKGTVKQYVTSTGDRQYFDLDGVKEFCQKIAAGEIKLEDLQAAYDTEDVAKERTVFREITEKAKKFQTRLDALGLKCTDLLELEVLAHSLGDMGHNILLDYERGEGWPSGT